MAQDRHDEELALRIHVEPTACHTVVTLHGELDYFSVRWLRRSLTDLVEQTGDILFDLSGLSFVDTAGIHCLASAVARVQGSGRRAELVSPSAMAERVIHLLGLAELMGLSGSPGASSARRCGDHCPAPTAAVRVQRSWAPEPGALPLAVQGVSPT